MRWIRFAPCLYSVAAYQLTRTDFFSQDDPTKAELRRMSVSPHHRRRGIASSLVKVLLEHAREHELSSVTLTTSDLQEDAISMYEKYGWTFRRPAWTFTMMVGEDVALNEYELTLV